MHDLPTTMRALVIDAPGAPPRIETRPVPRPGPGEVLVRVAASPINPSDLMTVRGLYGIGWTFPLVPGLEGSGRVVAAGGGMLSRYLMGRAVACVADEQGLWAEYAVTKAARCLALPEDMPLGPAAMSFVNPLTAIALVRSARRGGHRAAISTAAGGALGRMIEARGRQQGLKIISVVRRADQAQEMRDAGLRHVLSTDDPDFDNALKGLCRQVRCRMAFDAVGGELTGRLVEAMGRRSEVLVYGALAMQPVSLNPGTMIFKGATVRGFWLSDWLTARSFPQQLLMARSVIGALRGGFAESRVAHVFDLADGGDALAAYVADMSAGKVLISSGAEGLGLDTETGANTA
jgi:NADPH2:quinone reductase